MNTIIERLTALRSLMKEHGLSAYIIPGTDPHASEYMADRWKEITWITGFKGETGTVLVTLDQAFLWTDSRFYLQADKELAGTTVELMRESDLDTPSIPEWLNAHIAAGSRVGVNPEMFSVQGYAALGRELAGNQLSLYSIDLIRPLWIDGRPAIPFDPLFVFDEQYAGESVDSKLTRVRAEIRKAGAEAMVISALDEIAWLLNIRGNDVEFNPVVISYVLLEQEKCTLFVEPSKAEAARAYFAAHHITVAGYEDIFEEIKDKGQKTKDGCATTFLFDGAKLNEALYEAIPEGCKKIDTQSPILRLKSVKNETELAGIRKAMQKDAVALTRFFKWLEQEAFASGKTLTEYDLMEKLYTFRAAQEGFVEESFGTIAGYGANGAIVHYGATKEDCAVVEPHGILLLDSGGQYLDGTTDITRTICLDTPTDQMKRDFTLVLKGHIALACARFPRGTRGNQLDILARQFLWQEGLHYGHGTGHGVGHFLSCHEGPQNIRMDNNPTPLQIGNVCSDEPGLYRTGEYGIRTENLIAVVPVESNDFAEFYGWETLTLCFYDTKLFDLSIMTEQEIAWVNAYHQRVVDEICPLLTADEAAWLRTKCAPVG